MKKQVLFFLYFLFLTSSQSCLYSSTSNCSTYTTRSICPHLSQLSLSDNEECTQSKYVESRVEEILLALESCTEAGRPSVEFVCDLFHWNYVCPYEDYAFTTGISIISKNWCVDKCEKVPEDCLSVLQEYALVSCDNAGPCDIPENGDCEESVDGVACNVVQNMEICTEFNGLHVPNNCQSYNLRITEAKISDTMNALEEGCAADGRPDINFLCGRMMWASYVCTDPSDYRTNVAQPMITEHWCRERCEAISPECVEIINNRSSLGDLNCAHHPPCYIPPTDAVESSDTTGDNTDPNDTTDSTNSNSGSNSGSSSTRSSGTRDGESEFTDDRSSGIALNLSIMFVLFNVL